MARCLTVHILLPTIRILQVIIHILQVTIHILQASVHISLDWRGQLVAFPPADVARQQRGRCFLYYHFA